ncbi:MAG: ergothioneine biosynthesis protein EgtB [Byssovorax sp.]
MLAADLETRLFATRAFTESLCQPLAVEDYVLQSMPDASPTKWHLAHTTWFFETFVLAPLGEAPFDPSYGYLFNSYYNAVGERHPRARRGMLSRPTVAEVYRYRAAVDARLRARFEAGTLPEAALRVIELGLHHEQQHEELILTDIKHALAQSPLHPVYRAREGHEASTDPGSIRWCSNEGGLVSIGHRGEGFSFDNELPRHKVFVPPFALADRPVTAGEYIDFIDDGGYSRPELWLSDGWAEVQATGLRAPLYWAQRDGAWHSFTLRGFGPIDPHEPVCHLSYYEADAFARWVGARLPTEAEWEISAEGAPIEGNFVESGACHPRAASPGAGLRQLFGDVWEWTQSSYAAYPGFAPAPGAIGEYNGKFMCNQLVLRGGSCASPRSHLRASYRNFFPAGARWQLSGVRLCRDAR